MAISTDVTPYLERKGILKTRRPGPRLATGQLLVHDYPTGATEEKSRIAEGSPPPDRGGLRPWVDEEASAPPS